MDKMRMESLDMTAQNIEKIGALFPNCITETVDENGKPKKAINFEILKQMLSGEVIEGSEAYEFTWVGKKAAIVEANKPIRKTLRPCKEESVNWDTTENLYIEGDNLEVLKLLQESYLGAIKMIYIDPPYNTGNDFIYRDDFKQSADNYEDDLGVYDADGNRMFKNTDSNGRFHSDWCSMMYSRLILARNLLSDDGVIFVSIDDNENGNLKKICDEIFSEENNIGIFTWLSKSGGGSDNGWVVRDQEYVLCYAKKAVSALPHLNRIEVEAEPLDKEDEYGKYRIGRELNKWGANSRREDRPTMYFPIQGPNGEDVYPIRNDGTEGCWRWGKAAMLEAVRNHNCEFVARGDGTYIVYEKIRTEENRFKPYRTFMPNIGTTADGSKEIKDLFDDKKLFDFPKPVSLLKLLSEIGTVDSNAIILDFFSGSATTAHAIMQLNSEDGKKRKYIMVQLPEALDEKSEAYKGGYTNICEIGKERIRRAGKRIRENSPLTTKDLDIGFRVLKLDDSNMTDVYYSADEYSQGMLAMLESNVKADRTDLDLLFGCLLEWGLPLSLPYTSETIEGCTVHTYNDGDLIACFDESIPDSVIKTIAKRQPLRAVFRDSSFADSPSKINVGEIFKLLTPDTRVKVI